jgi:hypothetical protein
MFIAPGAEADRQDVDKIELRLPKAGRFALGEK